LRGKSERREASRDPADAPARLERIAQRELRRGVHRSTLQQKSGGELKWLRKGQA
jgi:hypothetical protein